MYHRRKLLLALIETFGGSLGAVDCLKLMFLFCQYTQHTHYDFFPYKYGAYSFLLNQDKLRLTDLGYLQPCESFQIHTQHYRMEIDAFTQTELSNFVELIGNLRGDDLLRKAYLEYPYYASRSEVAFNILTVEDYKAVQAFQVTDTSRRFFTIGYEGKSIDKYLNILIKNKISALVDVRKNPISQKYGFSKNQLKRYTESVGISYIHLPELGIPSNMRHNLITEEEYLNLFQKYKYDILPEQLETLYELRKIAYEKNRVAIMCFEASHTHCHRSKIAEYFQNDASFEIPIEHL